jgi:hypothetical protein
MHTDLTPIFNLDDHATPLLTPSLVITIYKYPFEAESVNMIAENQRNILLYQRMAAYSPSFSLS